MGVIKIVKSYPEIFGVVGDDLNEDDAWSIISSSKSQGSQTQKISFSIHTMYTAVCKLFKLGLRESAIELAKKVLKYAASQQHYSISQQLCNLLVRHSYLFEDKESVKEYDTLYKSYTNIIDLEYQTEKIYGELMYRNERGMQFDEIEIINGLDLIKEKLPFESMLYHYYYYSCRLMIADDHQYEEELLKAIDYFESLYFEHSAYLSVFVNKLIQLYVKNDNKVAAEILLKKHISRCHDGSTPWFRYLKTAVYFHLRENDIKRANFYLRAAMNNARFEDLSHEVRDEWEILAEELILISGRVDKR